MTSQNIRFYTPFLPHKKEQHASVTVIPNFKFDEWLQGLSQAQITQIKHSGFEGKSGQIHIEYNDDGEIQEIHAGSGETFSYADGSKIHNAIKQSFSKETLNQTSFQITSQHTNDDELNRLQIGWGWNSYNFNQYKKEDKNEKTLSLVLNEKSDKERIKTFVESICFLRDLVNTPANDMGPDELQTATEFLAKTHKVKVRTITDKDLIKKNFPMIFEVGKGSARRPRLLDFSWGNKNHPKVTLVGKGVCFDTGGYDIKPSQFMLNMKKDMGGSAHVLALAHMIMNLQLPIQLRVLIPAVENSISGEAYRPADILQSRKGITVEVGNTDAEGRLVLADALTYACEDKPELLIDFATLTGAARVALGTGLPALFSNTEKTAQSIQSTSQSDQVDDAVWNLPLWKPYREELNSPNADISSTGGKAGATTAALFLNEFIDHGIEWIHVDVYAWEDNGKPGRPKGGADTGLRAIFAFLEERYGK